MKCSVYETYKKIRIIYVYPSGKDDDDYNTLIEWVTNTFPKDEYKMYDDRIQIRILFNNKDHENWFLMRWL